MENPTVRLAYHRLKRGTGIQLRFAEKYNLAPGFRQNLERFYDKASPEDKARCLNLITAIDIGTTVRDEQAERRKKYEKRLKTDGVYYPQPPPPRPKSAFAALDTTAGTLKMGPYSTTYKREFVPRQNDPQIPHRPGSTTNMYCQAAPGKVGAVGETTYDEFFYYKSQKPPAPIQSEKWRNNPHPMQSPSRPDRWIPVEYKPCCKESPKEESCCDNPKVCCRKRLECECSQSTVSPDKTPNASPSPRPSSQPSPQLARKKDRKVRVKAEKYAPRGVVSAEVDLAQRRPPFDTRKQHPKRAFLKWRFPHQSTGEASASEWNRELTNDLMDAVCRGQFASTYQSDYLGLPQGMKPKNLYASLDPGSTDWRARVPYTFDTSTRMTYVPPEQQPEHLPNTRRYGCNRKKHISAVGAVPNVTRTAPQMSVMGRTTYETHYNDAAPYVRSAENVRDVGRELNVASLQRLYNATDDPKEKQKVLRMLTVMKSPVPPSSAAIRRNHRYQAETPCLAV